MSTIRMTGAAQLVTQVNTITPTASNNATYTLAINNKAITYLADASALVSEITAGLVAAWNASTIAEATEATAADGTTVLTITGDTIGSPFVQTSSASAGTLVTVATIAASGPTFFNATGNSSTGAAPVSTDDVIFDRSAINYTDGLANSAVVLASLTFLGSYTGSIGRPATNAGGYPEYRATELAISASVLTIGGGDGQGSPNIRLNLGSNACVAEIINTGTSQESGCGSVQLRGTSITSLMIHAGSVDLAMAAEHTATVTALNIAGGTVRTGSGCTVTTCQVNGGTVEMLKNPTTLTVLGGLVTLRGSNAPTTLTIRRSGRVKYNCGQNITTLTIGGTLDLTDDLRAFTIATVNLEPGASILDPFDRLTITTLNKNSDVKSLTAA